MEGKGKIGRCPLDKLSRSLSRMEKLSDRLEDDDLNSKSRKRIEAQLEELGNFKIVISRILSYFLNNIAYNMVDMIEHVFSFFFRAPIRVLKRLRGKCPT